MSATNDANRPASCDPRCTDGHHFSRTEPTAEEFEAHEEFFGRFVKVTTSTTTSEDPEPVIEESLVRIQGGPPSGPPKEKE